MAADFYEQWLGVPAGIRPPNHYELLRLPLFCDDQPEIEQAARAQMRKARLYQAHPDQQSRETCHRLLREIATAWVYLVTPEKKLDYDLSLRRESAAEPSAAAQAEERVGWDSHPGRRQDARANRHAEARAKLAIAQRDRRAYAFGELVRAHLRRWEFSPDEEMLLVAEAAVYGVADADARRIIADVSRQVDEELRRSHRLMKWTIGVGIAAVLLCVVVYGGIEARSRMRSHAADRIIAESRVLTGRGEWDAARKRLGEARQLSPHRSLLLERVAQEIDTSECKTLLAAARNALDADDWEGMYRRLEQIESVVRSYPGVRALRDEAVARALHAGRRLIRESDELKHARRWSEARRRIEQADTLAQAARVPAELVPWDGPALLEELTQAVADDWHRSEAGFHASFDAWKLDDAEACLSITELFHADHGKEIRELRDMVHRRRQALARLDRELPRLLKAERLDEAQRLIRELDLPDTLRLPRQARIDTLRANRLETKARHALEFAERARQPLASVAICEVMLADPASGGVRLYLKDNLARSVEEARGDASLLPAAEVSLTEVRLTDGRVLLGEVIEKDSLRTRVRRVSGQNPPRLGAEIDELPTSTVTSTKLARKLSDEESRLARQSQFTDELDLAIADNQPLRTLEIAGLLRVYYEQFFRDRLLVAKLAELQQAVWRVAELCPECLATGREPCSLCAGTGRVDGFKPCPRCNGAGKYTCPRCSGHGRIRCTRCHNGKVRKLVGWHRGNGMKSPIYDWVDCEYCDHGWIVCPACKGTGVVNPCKRCHGTGTVRGRTQCPDCGGKGEVPCHACGGTGKRKP